MKVLLGGGSGFLGSALAKALGQAGHSVTFISRRPSASITPSVGWDSGELVAAVEQSDAMINLAGAPIAGRRWSKATRQAILISRLSTTQALAKALQSLHAQGRSQPGVWLNGSAIGFYPYGKGGKNEPEVDETAEGGNHFLAQVCQAWEGATLAAADLGVRTVQLRTGLVLGRSGGALPLLALPFWWGMGGKMGPGTQWNAWIHLHDWVQMVLWLLEHPTLSGAVNLVAPTPEMASTVARGLGRVMRRPSLLPVPGWVLRLVLGEASETVLGSQRVVPQVAQQQGFEFCYPHLGPALTDLFAKTPSHPT